MGRKVKERWWNNKDKTFQTSARTKDVSQNIGVKLKGNKENLINQYDTEYDYY